MKAAILTGGMKPCQCGRNDFVLLRIPYDADIELCYVRCPACGNKGAVAPSPVEAKRLWNQGEHFTHKGSKITRKYNRRKK